MLSRHEMGKPVFGSQYPLSQKNFRLTHLAPIKIVFPVLFPTGVNTGNSVRWTERTRLTDCTAEDPAH